MKTWTEEYIRSSADVPSLAMLGEWHTIADPLFGANVDVHLADRHDNPQLAGGAKNAEVNTALPMSYKGRPVLMLWLESPFTRGFTWELITHEVGHWVLFGKGYDSIDTGDQDAFWTKACIVSLCHHTPLSRLQIKLGHDPQKVHDRAAIEKLVFYREYDMSKQGNVSLRNRALEIADSLIHTSDGIRGQFAAGVEQSFPQLFREAERIVDVVGRFNLSAPSENIQCQLALYAYINVRDSLVQVNQLTEWQQAYFSGGLKLNW